MLIDELLLENLNYGEKRANNEFTNMKEYANWKFTNKNMAYHVRPKLMPDAGLIRCGGPRTRKVASPPQFFKAR